MPQSQLPQNGGVNFLSHSNDGFKATCIMEVIEEPKAVSYTRDKDGTVTNRHLNDVYNTIHTGTGGGGNTDCYIAEPRVMQVGNLYPDTDNFKNRTMGRVYSADGLSPTINCCGGGDREPKILTPRRTEFGKQIRKQYEAHQVDMSRHDMTQLEPREDGISNTITTVQKDNLLAEPKIIAMLGRNPENPSERGKSNGKYRQRMEENKDGVSNTLTSVQKDNLVAEPLLIPEATTKGYAEAYDGDSVNLALPNSKTRRGRVGHQQANTLDTSCNQGVVTNYRIRKLTPRECFRLMDVSEPDIDNLLNAGISNSQLYKLAGNSIVVSCLYHIFRKMFIEKENENQQLTLF